MPATAPVLDYEYSPEDVSTTQTQRRNRQQSLSSSDLFRYPDLGNIMMLMPILDSLEAELGITIWVTAGTEGTSSTPASLRAAANIDSASNAVIIAQRVYFTHPPRDARELDQPSNFPAVMSRQLENDDNYPDWTIGHGVIAGKVAPHIITVPWWYANDESTPEQLESIHKGLRAAIELAMSPELNDEISQIEQSALARGVERLLANRSTEEINTLRRQVPDLIEQVADYERRIATHEQRLNEIKAQLSALEDAQVTDTDLAATAASEIGQTFAHPQVRDMHLDQDASKLTVFTEMLPLTNIDDDTQHIDRGGEYRLTIGFGPSPSIRVRNLTRRIGGYDHPHVSDGNFCLGDQRRLLDALIARSEISAAVSLTIDLLTQVNPSDTYTQEWTAWFDLDETELTDV